MVAKAERRTVAVGSWKRRRGNVDGPATDADSEKGDPRRGGSNVADGRSLGAGLGAEGWAVGDGSFIRGGGTSNWEGEMRGSRCRRASSPRLKPRLRTRRWVEGALKSSFKILGRTIAPFGLSSSSKSCWARRF
jgi:hypothetical protein